MPKWVKDFENNQKQSWTQYFKSHIEGEITKDKIIKLFESMPVKPAIVRLLNEEIYGLNFHKYEINENLKNLKAEEPNVKFVINLCPTLQDVVNIEKICTKINKNMIVARNYHVVKCGQYMFALKFKKDKFVNAKSYYYISANGTWKTGRRINDKYCIFGKVPIWFEKLELK